MSLFGPVYNTCGPEILNFNMLAPAFFLSAFAWLSFPFVNFLCRFALGRPHDFVRWFCLWLKQSWMVPIQRDSLVFQSEFLLRLPSGLLSGSLLPDFGPVFSVPMIVFSKSLVYVKVVLCSALPGPSCRKPSSLPSRPAPSSRLPAFHSWIPCPCSLLFKAPFLLANPPEHSFDAVEQQVVSIHLIWCFQFLFLCGKSISRGTLSTVSSAVLFPAGTESDSRPSEFIPPA